MCKTDVQAKLEVEAIAWCEQMQGSPATVAQGLAKWPHIKARFMQLLARAEEQYQDDEACSRLAIQFGEWDSQLKLSPDQLNALIQLFADDPDCAADFSDRVALRCERKMREQHGDE